MFSSTLIHSLALVCCWCFLCVSMVLQRTQKVIGEYWWHFVKLTMSCNRKQSLRLWNCGSEYGSSSRFFKSSSTGVLAFILRVYNQTNSVTTFSFSQRVPTPPGIFMQKFPGPGKSCKIILVLESPGTLSWRSWKVLEFAGTRTE